VSRDGTVRVVGASDVQRLLTWPSLLAATSDALVALATPGRAPAGSSTQVAVPGAALHLKVGALLDPQVLSVKANLRPDRGSSSGAILVFDHGSQRLEAVLASGDLTAMRTGAIAAVAARALIRRPRPVLALVGAGPVARQTLRALQHVLDLAEVRVWSRTSARAISFIDDATLPQRTCLTVSDAVAGADLVVTCTPSRTPLIERDDLAEGTVILAMGADSPGKRELGPGVLDSADVYVDVLEDALTVGECAALDPVRRNRPRQIGKVIVAGSSGVTDGRLVVFDSVGAAAVDAAATALVVAQARALGVGTIISLTD